MVWSGHPLLSGLSRSSVILCGLVCPSPLSSSVVWSVPVLCHPLWFGLSRSSVILCGLVCPSPLSSSAVWSVPILCHPLRSGLSRSSLIPVLWSSRSPVVSFLLLGRLWSSLVRSSLPSRSLWSAAVPLGTLRSSPGPLLSTLVFCGPPWSALVRCSRTWRRNRVPTKPPRNSAVLALPRPKTMFGQSRVEIKGLLTSPSGQFYMAPEGFPHGSAAGPGR